MTLSYDYLIYEVDRGGAEIALNRPPVNAFSLDLLNEILDVLAYARSNTKAWAVILRSDLPKVFCPGLDLDILFGKLMSDIRLFLEKLYIGLFDAQYGLGKLSIAVVNGAARGGGITDDAQEGIPAFIEKRAPNWPDPGGWISGREGTH